MHYNHGSSWSWSWCWSKSKSKSKSRSKSTRRQIKQNNLQHSIQRGQRQRCALLALRLPSVSVSISIPTRPRPRTRHSLCSERRWQAGLDPCDVPVKPGRAKGRGLGRREDLGTVEFLLLSILDFLRVIRGNVCKGGEGGGGGGGGGGR